MSRRAFISRAISWPLPVLLLPNAVQAREGDTTTRTARPANTSLGRLSQKIFADEMESGMKEYERYIASRKNTLFSMIDPTTRPVIADIGIGTGPNIPYLPHTASVIGIEPNEFMWDYAQQRANELGIDLHILQCQSEALRLPTASCDVVISTLTLCSVQDIPQSLHEINRVLKPGGLFIFIEHIIAAPSRPVLRSMQTFLTPLQCALSDGCHLNRDTGRLIESEFADCTDEKRLDYFDAKPERYEFLNALSPIRPHVAGFIRKKSAS